MEHGPGSRSLALRALLALLDALRLVCGVALVVRSGSDAASQIATACVPLLRSADASGSVSGSVSGSTSCEVRDGATAVLDALALIDGDCVCDALRAAQETEALVDAQARARRPKFVAATKAKASAQTRSAYAAALAATLRRMEATRRAPPAGAGLRSADAPAGVV